MSCRIHTNIGDSGNKLSGGQNKTFYRSCRIENPPIMILDEATSALDTERKICTSSFGKHDAKQNINCDSTPSFNHSKADTIIVMQKEKL
jgi:subfamily B ATP-binding cassette protein MsbA